jgi:hypothetical protein
MKPGILKSVIGGIIATAAMTIIMFMAPFMGLPEMNAAKMLSDMMQIPLALGWVMHFMIGVIFAITYGQFIIRWLGKISSKVLRGAILGVAVFVFAQIMMAVMDALMPAPKIPIPEVHVNMALMMAGSILGHVVYGIVVALIVVPKKLSSSSLL